MPLLAGSVVIALPQADLEYWPQWVAPESASEWLQILLGETPWKQPEIKLYGQSFKVPRQVAWYGDAEARYRYSGLLHEPLPWTSLLTHIRERVQTQVGQHVNGVLLNLYRDGQDAMGWHSDDEPELGAYPVIASLSLGATRTFKLARKDKSARMQIPLTHGSLLVMRGNSQRDWMHGIDKEPGAGSRINLTFRMML